MSGNPRPAERRQFGRRRTFVHGSISTRGRPSVSCIMRDISEGGALLEVAYPQWLPSRFRLTADTEGFEADCEIMHRGENTVGVRFTKPVKLSESRILHAPPVGS